MRSESFRRFVCDMDANERRDLEHCKNDVEKANLRFREATENLKKKILERNKILMYVGRQLNDDELLKKEYGLHEDVSEIARQIQAINNFNCNADGDVLDETYPNWDEFNRFEDINDTSRLLTNITRNYYDSDTFVKVSPKVPKLLVVP